MSDDLLSKMTSALAEEHDGATAAPEATRARVVRTLAERKPRRRKWLAIGIPAFAVFGGSTAWAAVTGNLAPAVERVVAVITGQPDEVKEATVAAPPKKAEGPAPSPVEESELDQSAESADEEPEPAVEVPGAPAPEVSSAKVPRQSMKLDRSTPPSKTKKPQLPPAEDHTDLLTYRSAHRAHFQEGNCDKAVAGYRKYLREQPGGTFALEAKYNLGVCLIRQGDPVEAKRMLQPFASGAYGNYRQKKAQELIEALGH